MNYMKLALLGLLLLASGGRAADEVPQARGRLPVPADVLFVGNSFTYYNNGLQNHFLGLMRSAGIETGRQRILTLSGGRLHEHVASLPSIAAARDWDLVILQGHSREAYLAGETERFRSAAKRLDEIIREHGARTALFMTWAYAGAPEELDTIAANYTALGKELRALVVPVGYAFAAARTRSPGIQLRMADRRHPTLAGTYLAACTFYAALVGRSPEGLDYAAGLDADVARELQAAAWRAVQVYFGDDA